MPDCRNRLIDVSVVDSAINQGLIDVSFEKLIKYRWSELYG